jgi:hypothetical protein
VPFAKFFYVAPYCFVAGISHVFAVSYLAWFFVYSSAAFQPNSKSLLSKRSEKNHVKCQKCGKPIGYVTVVARGISPFQQPVPNVKIVALCMEGSVKKE